MSTKRDRILKAMTGRRYKTTTTKTQYVGSGQELLGPDGAVVVQYHTCEKKEHKLFPPLFPPGGGATEGRSNTWAQTTSTPSSHTDKLKTHTFVRKALELGQIILPVPRA